MKKQLVDYAEEVLLDSKKMQSGFSLVVGFGGSVSKSLIDCEWIAPGMGIFRPIGNDSVKFYISDFTGMDHEVLPHREPNECDGGK